ncbi:retrovirus-related Pol polyprotein from transposon TNT 1-94 [Caerostris darwini]|uniref:Retrovirus-related Pol polyprotein from transposon TNT 1-94 n=1 Tax=Caerostris darwini TaxID=1538125 RepID=A0AAV4NG16_9ARAC|nr:retrovirus-related Pol polyprotein from transposon TNT 1-94 [Caerostris darwini]
MELIAEENRIRQLKSDMNEVEIDNSVNTFVVNHKINKVPDNSRVYDCKNKPKSKFKKEISPCYVCKKMGNLKRNFKYPNSNSLKLNTFNVRDNNEHVFNYRNKHERLVAEININELTEKFNWIIDTAVTQYFRNNANLFTDLRSTVGKSVSLAVYGLGSPIEAKSKRVSFKPIGRIRSTKPLQLLHMDVCGPLPVESRGGAKYFLSITDEFFRMVICLPLKEKSQVFEHFKTFQTNAQHVLNRKTISVYCDIGTPKQLRTKLNLRAKNGIMLGYARSSRGYRIWLLEEQKLIETCNVRFDESRRLANEIFNVTNLNNKTKNWTEF